MSAHPLIAALGAAVVVIGVVAGIALSQSGGGTSRPTTLALSEAGLMTFAKHLGRPVYWVGPQVGDDYEVRAEPNGRVLVAYVPAGAPVQPGMPYRAVGTYPFRNALTAVARLAARRGVKEFTLRNGGLAIYTRSRPTNVYVAFPDVPYEVEVYDPLPGEAVRLVKSGQVAQLG